MAHYYNHLIKKQQAIESQREHLLALASHISEAESQGDIDVQANLETEFVSHGQTLLAEVREIQERFHYLKNVGLEPSFDMSWLYTTAMRTMQDVYDYGLASMHLRLIREWPELAEWIRDRRKH